MNKIAMVICVIVLFALGSDARQAAKPAPRTPVACYDVLDRAYGDAHRIKPGMTRQQVEEKWELDGGIQQFNETIAADRYVYRDCDALKLEIEFHLDKKAETGPSDKVTKIMSHLYVERAILE
jgi:hypothetical protein